MFKRLYPLAALWPPLALGLAIVTMAACCLGSPGSALRQEAWAEKGRPAAALGAGERLALPAPNLPQPVARLVLGVYCEKNGCRDLIVANRDKVELPYRAGDREAFFLLELPEATRAPSLNITNNGPSPVAIRQASFRNYLWARDNFPGFWVLLSGTRGDRLSRGWLLFLAALALAMQGAALSPTLMRQDPRRLATNAKRLLTPPGLALLATLGLSLFGQSLVINAETFLALAAAGPLAALLGNRRFWRLAAGWVESSRAHLLPVAFVSLAAYTVWVLWTHFEAGLFSHQTLTVYNDWLANAVAQGRPFLQSDSGVSGLFQSFSPTLVLLTPFYWVFDSQFVLPVLGAAAVYFSLLPAMAVHSLLRRRLAPRPHWQDLLTALGLFVVLGANTYTKSAAMFTHPAAFYLLPASLCFLFLVTDRPWPFSLAAAAVALGVRQDAGLALAALLLLVFLFPRRSLARPGRVYLKTGVIMAASLAYTLLMRDWLGLPPRSADWLKGFVDLAMSFPAWGRAFSDSAWLGLNTAFAWLAIFHPATWLAVNLFGLAQFCSTSEEARHLAAHQADFLLPLYIFATILGLGALSRWLDAARGFLPNWRLGVLLAPLVWLGVASLATLANLPDLAPGPEGPRSFTPLELKAPVEWHQEVPRLLAACPTLATVAADEQTVTFVPNGYRRLLLGNFPRAQAVLLAQGAKTPFLKGRSFEEMDFWIRGTGLFRLVRFTPHLKFYVLKKIPCPGLNGGRQNGQASPPAPGRG